MYVVQIGDYAWLGEHAGRPCVTTSGAHAIRIVGNFPAAVARTNFIDDREPTLANSTLSPAHRALCRTLPVTVVPAEELDARLRRVHGHDAPRPAPGPKPPPQPRAEGVTRRIFQWVTDNPQATKADALAAFPGANPTTVGVQYGAARRAARE